LTLYKTLLRLTDSLLLFFTPGVLIEESNLWPVRSGRKTKILEEEEVNSNKLNLLTAAFAVALLGTGAAAQEGPRGPHGGFGAPGMELRALDLTDAQKAQVKQIMTAEKPTLKPLIQQEMQNHQQMTALVRGGSFEEAKAQPIATQEAQIHSQIALERAKIDAQIYQLLTPEQKTKLAEREAKRDQWKQQREQAGPPPAEPNQ
jgi:periplasmic protein CpxP/Spy